MKTSVFEIEKGIYRISVAPSDNFEFNHFLIVDEHSMLIHTGGKQVFDTLLKLVRDIVDPAGIDYITFSHFESDECGALNNWLSVAPNAVHLVNIIGKATMNDFSERECQIVTDNEIIDLGFKKVRILSTPHIPHGWEACMFYEVTQGILFSSDLGAQPGINLPFSVDDLTPTILKFQHETGFMPTGKTLTNNISRLRQLDINYMAPMHGSVLIKPQAELLFNALMKEN